VPDEASLSLTPDSARVLGAVVWMFHFSPPNFFSGQHWLRFGFDVVVLLLYDFGGIVFEQI